MKTANYNTRKGKITSFKKKFKLLTEISIPLPAENTNYYWFACTQHTRSCPETKHGSLKLCHLPQLMPYCATPQYVFKLWAHWIALLHRNSGSKREICLIQLFQCSERKNEKKQAVSMILSKNQKKKKISFSIICSPQNETEISEIRKRHNIISLFWTTVYSFI